MDIDHFKSFNDTFGHQAGDETLAAVAAAIAGACRASDVPARYGGEEMALLLPGSGLEDAVEVAERVRLAVAAIPLETRPVTVSIGVSTTDGTCSAELLIEASDRALYASKEGGRNRVTAERATVTAG
jgi:diguanylate cyclase (GGDEF)-like protein